MKTNSNKKISPVDYEGDMARLCEKIRIENDDYEFSTKEMVEPRTVDLKGLGRQGYSEEGYSDIKIPILKEKGYIIMTSEDKFKLTDKGKEYCKESTVI
jgi:hypothetical protein